MMRSDYEFSWKKLPKSLRECLADIEGLKANANDVVWSAKLGAAPDLGWIAGNWLSLRNDWLYKDLPNARSVSKDLISLGLGRRERYGRSRDEVHNFLCSCRASPALAESVEKLLWELGRFRPRQRLNPSELAETPVQAITDDFTQFQGLRRWAPRTDGAKPFVPHVHQEEAWEALNRIMDPQVVEQRGRGLRGLLVLPTGGGKTVAAVRWIAERYLQKEDARAVLWIAHRSELLEQASQSFGGNIDVTDRDRSDPLDVQCLSSQHGRGAERLVDAQIEVTCASIRTLTAGDNVHVVEKFLEDHPNAFIVIDEAHHSGAKSYRKIIELADRYTRVDVLGLTATPTRTAKSERGWLAKLFPDGIIYEADLPTLISRGVLARPIMRTVNTNESVQLSPKERQFLQQFKDYSPETLERLAKSSSRNAAIIKDFVSRKDDYGQTLIFAASVAHAYTLAKMFQDKDVEAEYVTYKVEEGRESNQLVLDRYRDEKIQVLISVTKLTEGVDLPKTQTVILARPTKSEILLKQMIGRALRGPAAKGTETAYLVSIADDWEELTDWLDPRSLFPATEIPEISATPSGHYESVEIPWDIYLEIARMVQQSEFGGSIDLVPAGWYDLTDFEGELNQRPLRQVLVFDHQIEGFTDLLNLAEKGLSSEDEIDTMFDGIPSPKPEDAVMRALVDFVDQIGHQPAFIEFVGREDYLPPLVAERFLANPIGSDIDEAGRIWDTTEAKNVFRDRNTYIRAVRRAVEDSVLDPGLNDWTPLDLTSELREPLLKGNWDLDELRDEVHKQMRLEMPVPKIGWSPSRLKRYWGLYTSYPPFIKINVILQTSSISRECLKNLIYHELLHHELGVELQHRGDFRTRERLYPDAIRLTAELDSIKDWFKLDADPQ